MSSHSYFLFVYFFTLILKKYTIIYSNIIKFLKLIMKAIFSGSDTHPTKVGDMDLWPVTWPNWSDLIGWGQQISSSTNVWHGTSNHRHLDCLLRYLFRCTSKKTSKLHITDFVKEFHQWVVDSPYKGPVMQKMCPFDDFIMIQRVISHLESIIT